MVDGSWFMVHGLWLIVYGLWKPLSMPGAPFSRTWLGVWEFELFGVVIAQVGVFGSGLRFIVYG